MTMKVINLDTSNPRWLEFIETHPQAGIFHHPQWTNLLADCYGLRPVPLALVDNNKVHGLLPLIHADGWLRGSRLVSLPFSDHCRPLVQPEHIEPLAEQLLALVEEFACRRLEIRWPMAAERTASGAEFLTHRSVLDEPDAMLARAHRTRVRQEIERARRAGVRVRGSRSWESVRQFHALHVRARRRLGVPVQPMRFFRLLWERLVDAGLGEVVLAEHEGRPVAGALFLEWNRTVMYKFGAIGPAGRSLGAGHLLLWESMLAAHERGCRDFDWGRTELRHESLRAFKRSWGAEETLLASTVAAAGSMGAGAEPAHGWLGSFAAAVIRRSPLWLCRGTGALFYRQLA